LLRPVVRENKRLDVRQHFPEGNGRRVLVILAISSIASRTDVDDPCIKRNARRVTATREQHPHLPIMTAKASVQLLRQMGLVENQSASWGKQVLHPTLQLTIQASAGAAGRSGKDAGTISRTGQCCNADASIL
jgi:hypothetical protein